jgi:hypothetical protein
MGTVNYTDAWSAVDQGKPMTEPNLRPIGSEPGEGLAGLASGSSASNATDARGGSTTTAELLSWAEQAFGPAFAGFGRELGTVIKRLNQPMALQNPWLWIGGAALVGYALGRTGILRPIASFGMRTALNTLVERALRG